MIDLLIPTRRWNAYTRAFLAYLAGLASTSARLHLHIADNSCDPDKHRFLAGIAGGRVRVYPHETDLGLYGNLRFLMGRASSPYVQIFGDDDWIHADWFDNVAHLEEAPRLSGVMGPILFYPSDGKAASHPGDRFMAPDATERAIDYVYYMINEVGINTCCFAIRRREDVQIFSSFLEKHAFNYQFHDQLLTQIGLLRGPMKGVDHGLVVYNTRHDATSSGTPSSLESGYVAQGLPPWFGGLHFFLYGAEYATLYQFRDVPDDFFRDREEAANRIFMIFFGSSHLSPEAEEHLGRRGLLKHLEAVRDNPTAAQGVASLHRIIAAVDRGLGEKYAAFLNRHTHFSV